MNLLLGLLLLTQAADSATLHVYRYWRAPDVTSVVGFVAIPLSTLTFEPAADGAEQRAAYRVDVVCRDADGNVLDQASWAREIRAPRGPLAAGASAVEELSYDLMPGRYEVAVILTDSAGGRVTELRRVLSAAGARPLAGDLLLATRIEAAAEDVPPPAGTLVRSGTVITPNLRGVVRHEAPMVSLYAEVYPPPADTGSVARVSVVLRSSDGTFRQETPAAEKRYPPEGGAEFLHIPLAGLQPGEYAIGLSVQYADTGVVVERPFTVAAPTAPVIAEATGPFAAWDETSLDSLFAIAEYIADANERRAYGDLSVDGKRRFMERFWAVRDPTPGTPNEFYQDFVSRVAYANREFAGRRGGPGWASARGRIHIVHGPPAERYTQGVVGGWGVGRTGRQRPFEIWKYAGGRNDKYVFYDESDLGVYHLVYSTDPNEPSMPNWERLFDQEIVDLIRRF